MVLNPNSALGQANQVANSVQQLAQKYGLTLNSAYKPQTVTALTSPTTSPTTQPVHLDTTPTQSGTIATHTSTIPTYTTTATPTSGTIATHTTTTAPTTYSVQKGDTLSGLAQKYGMSLSNLEKLNPGINYNMLSIGQKLNVGGTAPKAGTPAKPATPVWTPPTSYGTLQSPSELMNYAKQQAGNTFQNAQLGYQQMIDQYNKQMSQLQTNDQINHQAQTANDLKYADALTALDTARNNANNDYTNQLNDMNYQYNQGLNQYHNDAFHQRQNALESMYARGLGYSTVLDQRQGMIDQAEQSNIGKLTSDLGNNVAKLDNDIATSLQNLDIQKASLTKQQKADLSQNIADMMKARDDQKAKLQQLVDQQNQLINQARTNQTADANKMYGDLFSQYANLYQQQQAAAEAKREFDLNYALKKQAGSSSGGGGSSYRRSYGGSRSSSGGSSSSSSSSSSKSSSVNVPSSAYNAVGSLSPSQKLALGQGPISDSYAKKGVLPVSQINKAIQGQNALMKTAFPWMNK